MIEPDILTIGELAARWQQTPLQIVNHAQALRIPLYFPFEGLVFDVNDHWHRDTGDYEQTREIDILNASITQGESRIKRSARRDVSKWEDSLSFNDGQKLRADIEANKRKRTALTELLEQRRVERNRCECRGYLRATPSTLWDISTTGAARFPHKAFHPHSPIHIATLPDRSAQGWEGRLVALEPGPGCDRYKKDVLNTDELCAFMVEVKAIEAHQAAKQQTAPAQNVATPEPVGAVGASMIHSTKARRHVLTPVIEFAQKQCSNPQDAAEVWAALLVLAEKKHAPLIGCTEAGLQYLKNGTAAYLSRDALKKRLDR